MSSKHTVNTLITCFPSFRATASNKATTDLLPAKEDGRSIEEMIVVPISLNLIQQISTVRIAVAKDLKPRDKRVAVLKSIREVKKRFESKGGVPLLDPVGHLGIKERTFKDIMAKVKQRNMEKACPASFM